METERLAPRLSADHWRYYLSDGIALVGVGILILVSRISALDFFDTPVKVISVYLAAWTLRCVLYSILTWWVFRRADGDTLAAWLREGRTARRKRRSREVSGLSSGPSGAASFCVLALAVVVYCAATVELRESPLVVTLAAVTVIASWQQVVVLYAVHYARENANIGGLTFTGAERDGSPRFADYFYLAVQVSTSFTAADVSVGSRAMRRVVTGHSIIGFVFSTAVIALLVSFLIVASS